MSGRAHCDCYLRGPKSFPPTKPAEARPFPLIRERTHPTTRLYGATNHRSERYTIYRSSGGRFCVRSSLAAAIAVLAVIRTKFPCQGLVACRTLTTRTGSTGVCTWQIIPTFLSATETLIESLLRSTVGRWRELHLHFHLNSLT